MELALGQFANKVGLANLPRPAQDKRMADGTACPFFKLFIKFSEHNAVCKK